MLKFPLILLSYDNSKRLFSLESEGTKSLPVFTDASVALTYRRSMQNVLRHMDETRQLTAMICPTAKACLDLLQAVVLVDPLVVRLDVNPDAPGTPIAHRSIGPVILELDEVIQDLRDDLANQPATSAKLEVPPSDS